jgi:hypothetical protein
MNLDQLQMIHRNFTGILLIKGFKYFLLNYFLRIGLEDKKSKNKLYIIFVSIVSAILIYLISYFHLRIAMNR